MKFSIASRAGAALLFLFLLSFPAAAQVSDVYFVPAAADGPGAGGTVWRTSFHLMNPQPYELFVTLVFLPTGGAAADSDAFTLEIPANVTANIENIVAEFFTNATTGALLVAVLPEDNPSAPDPDDVGSRAVILQTRTFNVRSDGTVGQGIDGAMTGLLDYESDGITAIATGVQNYGSPGLSGFRTNVGAVNLGESEVMLQVIAWTEAGESLGTIPFRIPPLAHLQDRLPVEMEGGVLEFYVEDPVANPDGFEFVVPYASVVDNRTGDATFLDPKLLATPCVGNLFPFATGRISSAVPRVTSQSIRPILDAFGPRDIAKLVRDENGAMRIERPLADQ